MNHYLTKILVSFGILIPLSLVFRNWFLPIPIGAGDAPFFYPENLISFFDLPQTWYDSQSGTGLGLSSVFLLWSYPIIFLLGFFHHFLNFDFVIGERLVWLLPFLVFGTLSPWYLAKTLNFSKIAAFFSVLLFLFNTAILIPADGGQLGFIVAYTLLPLFFVFFLKSLLSFRFKVLASSVLAGITFYDLKVTVLALGLVALYAILSFLLDKSWQNFSQFFKQYFSSFLVIFLIFLGLNFYWLAPLVLAGSFSLPAGYGTPAQVGFLSFAKLSNGIFLYQPHWPTNIFGKINPIGFEFFLLPVLAFLPLVFRPRDKNVLFFSLIAIVSIFLAKGTNDPGGNLYLWLTQFPGFNFFRDATKFLVLIAFSYAFLWGIAVSEIYQRIKNLRLKTIFLVVFYLYLIFLVRQAVFGELPGILAQGKTNQDYFQVKEFLAEKNTFFRTLWLPQRPAFGYASNLHPALEGYELSQKRPTASLMYDTYNLFGYLLHPFAPQFLDILGIKYLLVPHDVSYGIMPREVKNQVIGFLDFKSPWLFKSKSVPNIDIYEIKSTQDRFFAVPKTLLVVGPDDFYKDFGVNPQFKLSNLGLVFLENNHLNLEDLSSNSFSLFFNKSSKDDLVFSFLPAKYFISPYKFLDLNSKTWQGKSSFEFIYWQDFLRRKNLSNSDFDYQAGVIYSEKPEKIEIPVNIERDRNYVIAVRYFANTRGGELAVKIDGAEKVWQTTSDSNKFAWEKFDTKLNPGFNTVILENKSGFNAVNVIVVIPQEEFENISQKTDELTQKLPIFEIKELQNFPKQNSLPQISYKFIRSTLYELEVKNAKESFVLAFSESFHPFWKAKIDPSTSSGQAEEIKPLPLYGLMNGFPIKKTGDFKLTLEFTQQKYIAPSLLASGLFLFGSLLYLLLDTIRTRNASKSRP